MRTAVKYFLIIIAAVSLSYVAPKIYSMAFKQKVRTSAAFYSAVLRDFMVINFDEKGIKSYEDTKGNTYNDREYAQNLPFMMYRDLIKWGTFPAEVNGVAVKLRDVPGASDYGGMKAKDSDKLKKQIQLFPLFETKGTFIKLEMPTDIFRMNKRIEFLIVADNRVDEAKSKLFTDALVEEGFTFPAKAIYGNPTVRKPYDAGYFIEDANGAFFNLLQENGQPVITKMNLPEGLDVYTFKVQENEDVPYIGMILTSDGGIYHVLKDGFGLVQFQVDEKFDPKKDDLRYSKDLLSMSLSLHSEDRNIYYGYNNAYELEKKHIIENYSSLSKKAEAVQNTIFPFVTKMSIPEVHGSYLHMKLSDKPYNALLFSGVLALIYLGVGIKIAGFSMRLALDSVLTLFGGLFAMIPAAIFSGALKKRNKHD
jgi:hypothetical protein